MTPSDQEKLFQRVRQKFPDWSDRKCSGYVHGIVDEPYRMGPDSDRIQNAIGRQSEYDIGYLCGFIDARGSDILEKAWARLIRPKVQFVWWTK